MKRGPAPTVPDNTLHSRAGSHVGTNDLLTGLPAFWFREDYRPLSLTRSGLDHVANAVNGMNVNRLGGVGLDLSPQITHVCTH
jgi:hypothetical protein